MPFTENPNMFSMDGPVMSGRWFNPHTGDTFTVKDSFFQDGQYTIQTTDGRLLGYNQLQNYVKSDEPVNSKNNSPSALPPEVEMLIGGSGPASNSQDILPEDMAILAQSYSSGLNRIEDDNTTNECETGTPQIQQAKPNQTDFDAQLINRMLNNKIHIKIAPQINWSKYPKKEIDILVNMFGVDEGKITDYILSNIDINQYITDAKLAIINYIQNPQNESIETKARPTTPRPKATTKTAK